MSGRYLRVPNLEKATYTARGRGMYVAWSSMQNYRETNEDEQVVYIEAPYDKKSSYFAIHDGHGGPEVARYAGRHLARVIQSQAAYVNGNIERGIHQGFKEIDRMIGNSSLDATYIGTTANVAVIIGLKLYMANLGDSRAIACIRGNIVQLTQDHKPDHPSEKSRIESAGFPVIHHRVNGELSVSRALGDFAYKNKRRWPPEQQAVSCVPDVTEYNINENWEFMLLGCDGIFDMFTTEAAGQFIREKLYTRRSPEGTLEDLFDACSSPDGFRGGRGSDNVTGILIIFANNLSLTYRVSMIQPHIPITYPRLPAPPGKKSRGSKKEG